MNQRKAAGTVYLVGAGPGDPELITQRGARLLAKADCVIYDRLVDPKILEGTKTGCERIYVGKGSDEGGRSQFRICRLICEKARRYSTVVRLKGGDPSLFGRITEELEALSKAGIPFEIVPGVSSVWAAAAAAGIPLTDRRYSSSVTVVTGQEASGKRPSVRWENLSRGADTLVVLMGRSVLPQIVRRLRASGRSGSTPVALIRWVSTPRQQVLVSTLGRIERDLDRRPQFGPPVVTIIGQVVRRRRQFRPQPLKGKRVLVTRPSGDTADLSHRLEELGATCVKLPTIAIRPRAVPKTEAQELLGRLPRYHWILFTSHHGVEGLQRIARRSKRSLRRLVRAKICAIGPRTAESVRAAGLKVDLVPANFSTAGIREAFGRIPVRGRRVLIPRSNLGVRDLLAQQLRRSGACVDEPILYETVALRIPSAKVKQALRRLDVATFTSASTVTGFLEAISEANVSLRRALNGAVVAAIGPATAQALRAGGIRRFYLPKEGWTVDGLVQAVVEGVANA